MRINTHIRITTQTHTLHANNDVLRFLKACPTFRCSDLDVFGAQNSNPDGSKTRTTQSTRRAVHTPSCVDCLTHVSTTSSYATDVCNRTEHSPACTYTLLARASHMFQPRLAICNRCLQPHRASWRALKQPDLSESEIAALTPTPACNSQAPFAPRLTSVIQPNSS